MRHYHHLGLLPEPERQPNGYRHYALRHAVVLARIRRPTELGRGPAEVRDVVADDAGRDLAGVLAELDDDLGEAPGPVERAHEAYALLDALAGADPADRAASRGPLELAVPIAHFTFLSRRQDVRLVRLHADAADGFVQAVRQGRTVPSPFPDPPG